MTTIIDIENALTNLLDSQHASLSIRCNDHHHSSKLSLEDFMDLIEVDDEEWVSPIEKQKAYETDTLWSLQVYPRTPVGFYTKYASSLPALIWWVLNNSSTEPKA